MIKNVKEKEKLTKEASFEDYPIRVAEIARTLSQEILLSCGGITQMNAPAIIAACIFTERTIKNQLPKVIGPEFERVLELSEIIVEFMDNSVSSIAFKVKQND